MEMKKCLIIANTHKELSVVLAESVKKFLNEKKIEAEICFFDGCGENANFDGVDFVVSLGGDGTVLFAARGCVKKHIPVFPINLGEFGFISSVQKDEWQKELERFLLGKSSFDERIMLNAALISEDGREFFGIGLNDVVIAAKMAARTILFDVFYNDIPLGTFKADGIIISTATGSTAYSASAGGPIIDPDLDAFVLTPINSFSLSSRPLVLSPKGEIGIKILPSRQNDVIITIDGQEPHNLKSGDFIKIRRLPEKIKLVNCTAKKFYSALRSKLNWAGGPHA